MCSLGPVHSSLLAVHRPPPDPSVGDLLTLNASLTSCSNPRNRTGRVVAVGDRSIVVTDTANPSGGFTDAEYEQVATIFDDLAASPARGLVRDWRTPEIASLAEFEAALAGGELDWGLIYLPGLDGLLHAEGSGGAGVAAHLAWYEERIRRLREAGSRGATEFRLYVFSDHGMSDVREGLDLITPLEGAFGRNGDDYLAFYDSTMVRVWADDPALRERIGAFLEGRPKGRLVADAERAGLGVAFSDRSQGDLTWVCDEGAIILPSYMGRTLLAGMHGYHPDAVDADACLLGTGAPGRPMEHIRDLHGLMGDSLQWVEGAA